MKKDKLNILQKEHQERLNQKADLETGLKSMQDEESKIIERREHFFPNFEKKLLDQYLKLKGNIRVFLRIRPILSNDFKAYEGSRESFTQLEQ